MDKARTTGSPWRSWTAIAFVLVTLALIQACDSGKHTGPSSNTSLQLKLRRATGAELPAGCTGVYSVTGPGVNIQNSPLPANGQIVFQGQIGQTYTISVTVTCGGEVLSGSAQVTLGIGDNTATIILTFTKVTGVSCSPNPVDPGKDSICTCNAKSAGTPVFSWTGQGLTQTSGNPVTFNSSVPGGHDVSCSVNGVANGSTTVTVAQQNVGRITVNSTLEGQEGNLSVTFTPGSAGPMGPIAPGGQQTQNNVPAGPYTAHAFYCGECSCDVSFTLDVGENQVLNLPSDCD